MAKSLEERVLSERAQLRLPAEEKLSIVETEAGPKTKKVLRDALRYESHAELHWEIFRIPIVVAETRKQSHRSILASPV